MAEGLPNGWQISGITSLSSGAPMSVGFSGDLATTGQGQAWFGSPDVQPFYAAGPEYPEDGPDGPPFSR